MYDLNRHPMTEDQIERHVQHYFDRLDRKLMSGRLSQEQYDTEAEQIRLWADSEYRRNRTFG